jgi:hypothetical protein
MKRDLAVAAVSIAAVLAGGWIGDFFGQQTLGMFCGASLVSLVMVLTRSKPMCGYLRSESRAESRAIKALNLTRIIIAHRPETIASADRVIVLQNGRIAQDLRRQREALPADGGFPAAAVPVAA